MNKPDFDAAVKAAKEFLTQAKRVEWKEHPWREDKALYAEAGRETAALKRRSMDLTRALADLRHPDREKK